MIKLTLLCVLVTLLFHITQCAQDIQYTKTTSLITIENGYLHLEFDLKNPRISKLTADFTGHGHYGSNLVGKNGICLEHDVLSENKVKTLSSADGAAYSLSVYETLVNQDEANIDINNVVDSATDPFVKSKWSIRVQKSHRDFVLSVETEAVRDSEDTLDVRISNYLTPTSSTGFFQRGVQQMMNSSNPYFASTSQLVRYFALGATGSIHSTVAVAGGENVILSSTYANEQIFRSGVIHVVHGEFPVDRKDIWQGLSTTKFNKAKLTKSQQLKSFKAAIAANNMDFPVVSPHNVDQNLNVNFEHLRALYTGVYASPVGALVSYQFPSGVISPTVAFPNRGYWPLFNFYDPDSFFSISAMMYASDPYVNNECRKMLETTGKLVKPDGQLPHHFIGGGEPGGQQQLRPTFEAISGATQTGPNIFWTLSALQYVKNSGDYKWLREQADTIRLVMKYITDRYNPEFQLINAPGPLQIDTMIRNNYTSDTNAMAIYLLDQVAEMQDYLGQPSQSYRDMAKNIKVGMNKWLYRRDHFITQINPDKSTRDFIDYDANLLAVAFDVPEPQNRSLSVMKRILSGKCVHGDVKKSPRGTFVSEIYYDAANCYGGNTGDSDISMGRIAWAEAHALVRMNDISGFYEFIFDPLVEDLIQHTWLYERYDCNSNPAHNSFYIEYPELIAMLVREIVFGIETGLTTIRINPKLPGGRMEYQYAVGDLRVDYDGHHGNFLIKSAYGGGEQKKYRVGKFVPNTTFIVDYIQAGGSVKKSQEVTTCEHGVLHFDAPFGGDWEVSGKIKTN